MDQETILRCPACSQLMKKARRTGLVLDVCLPCSSTWFDSGELERMAGRPLETPANLSASTLPCPRCSGKMLLARMVGKARSQYFVCQQHGAFTPDASIKVLAGAAMTGAAVLAAAQPQSQQSGLSASDAAETTLDVLDLTGTGEWVFEVAAESVEVVISAVGSVLEIFSS